MRRTLIGWLAACVIAVAASVSAQTTDPIAAARSAETPSARARAIGLLRDRLTSAPDDADAARWLAVVLARDGQYDEARTLLQGLRAKYPRDIDVIVALANVELWSQRPQQAREIAQQGLAFAPNDPELQRVLDRALDQLALGRRWTLSAGHALDTFSDSRPSWNESLATIGWKGDAIAVIAGASRAERFSLTDQQFQVEIYPRLSRRSSAYVALAASPDHALYPEYRISADLYQGLPGGLEVAAGFRRLAFDEPVSVYVGAISKYLGPWMITERVFYVPSRTGQTSQTFHTSVRRYFGSDGTSFGGVRYSRGLAREELVSLNDAEVLASDTFAGDLNTTLGGRLRLTASASLSRQERAQVSALWQRSLSLTLGVRF